jgi:ComF family protein
VKASNRLSWELRVRGDWFLRQLRLGLRELLLPQSCPSCGASSVEILELCAVCDSGLEPLREVVRCRHCTGALEEGEGCTDCLEYLGALDRIQSVFAYRGTGGALVRRLKLQKDPAALGYLGRRLARSFLPRDREYRRFQIVPVPLARKRRRNRGFNQAAELGRFLSLRLGIPLREHALRRYRDTLPQGSPDVQDRAENLREVFKAGRQARLLKGARILLIDDVVTSGATLRACAEVLVQEAGVTSVEAITACTARRRLSSSGPLPS